MRSEQIQFGDGFYPPERDAAGNTWRWMGRRGVVELPRARSVMTLRLTGWVPLELFRAAPRVRLTLDGHEIDNFVPLMRDVRKEYIVGQALTAATRPTLVLEVSQSGQAPGDARQLGLAISFLDWQAASPVAP